MFINRPYIKLTYHYSTIESRSDIDIYNKVEYIKNSQVDNNFNRILRTNK